jgi:hypothetical protein
MIINYFDPMSITLSPFKANPVLIVDVDAELSFSVAFEFLQVIGRWSAQVIQCFRVMQHSKLAIRHSLHILIQAIGTLSIEYLLRFIILE